MEKLQDIDLKDKRVIIRVDFNVPLNEMQKITSAKRIEEAIPTIQLVLQKGAKVILCSHLGRPKGEYNAEMSLQPVYEYLTQRLSNKIYFSKDCIGDEAVAMSNNLQGGEILLLENLRFHSGEEANDEAFAKELSKLGDFFINDAFGTSHRKHASNFGLEALLPHCNGLLMEKEMEMLNLNNKKHPIVAILGGAKVSDKIDLITNLINKVDCILIGGAMAFTFIKALNGSVANSKVEDDKLESALKILENAKEKGVKIVLPLDFVIAKSLQDDKCKKSNAYLIPTGFMGVDIGRKTVKAFVKEIKGAETVFWNGPLGVVENEKFAKGSLKIAKQVAKSKAFSIVGGGDTVALIEKARVGAGISFISTGGGASLYYLQNN
ncbi:MAG: phosphoglycerate kinase [Christensenellales bacterium]